MPGRPFLLNDPRAWRGLLAAFVTFGGVGLLFVFGAAAIGIKGAEHVERWLGLGLPQPWALIAAVTGFTALAFLGIPQIVLVAAAVVAFGPWTGFLYAWLGNLVSAVLGFLLGRRFGAGLLRDYGGETVSEVVELVGRYGFWASLLVRLVPSVPFLVVNVALGVTAMRLAPFTLGVAIGSVPKIALVAFAGNAARRGFSEGGVGHWLGLAAAVVVWVGTGLAARTWIRRRRRERQDA